MGYEGDREHWKGRILPTSECAAEIGWRQSPKNATAKVEWNLEDCLSKIHGESFHRLQRMIVAGQRKQRLAERLLVLIV